MGRTSTERLLKSQGLTRLRKLRRTRVTICTYNARTLASEASVEDLMMQARKIKYDVIGLTEMRRHHPLHAGYDSGEELFLGTCNNRGVGGVGVLVNTHLAMNIDSYESLTTRIGCLRLKRCGFVPALTVFVAYSPTPDNDDEGVEAFYVELEKFYKKDHTFYKVVVGDFNAKIVPRSGTSNEIDHIIFNRKYCLTDVSVVPKFYTGSDHRLLRARFRFSRQREKAVKLKKRNLRTNINWDLYTPLAGLWKDTVMDNIDEEYDRLCTISAIVLREPRA
ncbi:unnamed protein product [Heligmosomoides polygyrus]|uniref:Endo/exonuclease/phosphatase domain-containing protein n=1 Tax=Heligmosomoides polygyrus TaxID=6339 RepID=A0A183G462_HELPZ|nr:unnamed protein product [Heligmosomoides polygyrus]